MQPHSFVNCAAAFVLLLKRKFIKLRKSRQIIRFSGFGGPERDRTVDLRVANAALSQLSYKPIFTF